MKSRSSAFGLILLGTASLLVTLLAGCGLQNLSAQQSIKSGEHVAVAEANYSSLYSQALAQIPKNATGNLKFSSAKVRSMKLFRPATKVTVWHSQDPGTADYTWHYIDVKTKKRFQITVSLSKIVSPKPVSLSIDSPAHTYGPYISTKRMDTLSRSFNAKTSLWAVAKQFDNQNSFIYLKDSKKRGIFDTEYLGKDTKPVNGVVRQCRLDTDAVDDGSYSSQINWINKTKTNDTQSADLDKIEGQSLSKALNTVGEAKQVFYSPEVKKVIYMWQDADGQPKLFYLSSGTHFFIFDSRKFIQCSPDMIEKIIIPKF